MCNASSHNIASQFTPTGNSIIKPGLFIVCIILLINNFYNINITLFKFLIVIAIEKRMIKKIFYHLIFI